MANRVVLATLVLESDEAVVRDVVGKVNIEKSQERVDEMVFQRGPSK